MAYEPKVNFRNSNRVRTCRWCRQEISKDKASIVIENVYLCGNLIDIHFHEFCWEEIVDKMNAAIAKKINEDILRNGFWYIESEGGFQYREGD